MGVIKQGILGGVSGKVGTVIGGSWKGIDYLRSIPSSVANPKTQKQQMQRSKFLLVLNFLKPLTGFLSVGFRQYANGQTGFNVAMSYNVKNAVSGVFPNYAMNYPNAQLSRGNLTGVASPVVASTVAKTVKFTWQDNSTIGNAKSTDLAQLVVYFPTLNEAVYALNTMPRNIGSIDLTVPAKYSTKQAQCYMTFQSADGKEIATSTYIGTVTVM
jgi:hypothetical protein